MATKKTRVYVVEDSPRVCELLDELVEESGGVVVGHSDSAPAALSDIASLRPDAVIIDIALRVGNGFEVLEAIAINDDEQSPVPIVLTNHTVEAYREAARALGVRYFFDKSTQIGDAVDLLSHHSGTFRRLVA
jgi:CheY-like chemotaxis protein